ncbi:uncharacterized protein B0J16DRAFT_345930 [Fusarium flagelliforme]|uniref:uncharacterized protein n=1 Tax=Fusarium flagelliforme TaxID=2675880 RepID=UPI001E8D0A5A|nr:uncharacterized protein B0J16DRAFT_345930 [Fusarium flagelliforme]KAH7183539.1 hypothetical protein B0J16DRAFT_345930 [Fusarium flagelliforme]
MFVETSINTLPIELLSAIFTHVRDSKDGQESIGQCRLVSRRFREHVSVFLINEITVRLSSESFTDLETIASHPVFSKGVKKVNIMVSYYEAELAQNKQMYMAEAESRLLRHWETMERMRQYRKRYGVSDELFKWLGEIAWGGSSDLQQLIRGDALETTPTPIQKLFLRTYDIYVARFDDQETLRKDNAHIGRLVNALSSLPALVSLNLDDMHGQRILSQTAQLGNGNLDPQDFEDTGFNRDVLQHFDNGIRQSSWSGSFHTNGNRRHNGEVEASTTPPVEMLGEFCSQLAEKGIRPKEFKISLKPPPDMLVLTMTSVQQEKMKQLVSHASSLTFHFDFFARPYSLQENPKHEMLALGSITTPFFSAPHLQTLDIYFKEYPRHESEPTVSLSEMLPLDITWPQLKTLRLKYQPMTIDELRGLVNRQRETVRHLDLTCLWLLKGSIYDVLETVRGFSKLEKVIIPFPKGSGFEGTGGIDFEWPVEEISRYLLRDTDVHPLGDELVYKRR